MLMKRIKTERRLRKRKKKDYSFIKISIFNLLKKENMKRLFLMIVPTLISVMRKNVKFLAILLIVVGLFSCEKQSSSVESEEIGIEEPQTVEPEEIDITFVVDEVDDIVFCSCLDLENINKTIPIINKFLAGLPVSMSKEQVFQSLETWLKSFSCNIDAKILYRGSLVMVGEQIFGVSISVKDGETVRELELDFAVIDGVGTYSQIAGYLYYKQDCIYVKTGQITTAKLFDFINSLDFDVKFIYNGVYVSNMPSDNLQYILDCLNAKPYTNDGGAWWTSGYLHYLTNQITIFPKLYDMKNRDYQDDWLKSMNDFQLIERSDSGHIIVLWIPEGTGTYWEAKFMEYGFVNWAEMSYSRNIIC